MDIIGVMGEHVGLKELLEAHRGGPRTFSCRHACTANLVCLMALLMMGPSACKQAVEDPARTAARYQKACDGGEMRGCTNLGFLYEQGTGVVRDAAKAVTLYQTGTSAGGESTQSST